MTPEKQKEIVQSLCDSLRDEMLKRIDACEVPEEWDGIELRQWFAELAWRERTFIFGRLGYYHPGSKRVTSFRRTVLESRLV